MKSIIQSLNKVFENRIRLGIMSMLMVNEWVDFNTIKDTLAVTDGNLASHLNTLEKNDYIQIEKKFVNRKPRTDYKATKNGQKAFRDHLDALEKILKGQL